jgi:hypothetical protein
MGRTLQKNRSGEMIESIVTAASFAFRRELRLFLDRKKFFQDRLGEVIHWISSILFYAGKDGTIEARQFPCARENG